MLRVAILVDGGFYRKRANSLFGQKTPEKRAEELVNYCKMHLHQGKKADIHLYRIFYYDCPPCDKNVYHPLLQRAVDLKKNDLYAWMNTFLNELKSKRKSHSLELFGVREHFHHFLHFCKLFQKQIYILNS